MSDTDDETPSYQCGYLTPPLSPAKTDSTEGLSSPRTPATPRKIHNYCFTRAVDNDADATFSTYSASPKKAKSMFLLGAAAVPEVLHATGDIISAHSADDSPVNQEIPTLSSQLFCPGSPTIPRLHTPTTLNSIAPDAETNDIPPQDKAPLERKRTTHRSVSDSLLELSGARSCTMPNHIDPIVTSMDSSVPEPPDSINPMEEDICHTKIRRLPVRYATLPLGPSQWAARGDSLRSPRKSHAAALDRFIACRRPSPIARESFELNKPAERWEAHQLSHHVQSSRDPFSPRLRRSARFNEELRGLREAHSMMIRRFNAYRRNTRLSYRHNSSTAEIRQISAGAVWNVGGPSAVSDTVVGVSTGRGGMLGSGTNAPLYTSSFLNRADPEAELEAYERRLALALDVDQADRILQHSPTPILHNERHGGAKLLAKHTWRDSAWIKDGVTSFLDAPQLRDDYYCTLLAYSYTAKCLAVGLGDFVHLWSEKAGVDTPESLNVAPTSVDPHVQHVTSLGFSSTQGSQAILAVGRADGRVSLWSRFDSEPRFDATQPKPISCVSWRPTTVQRPSLRDSATVVATEELLIGDEVGHIYFYSIEWPSETQSALFSWHGAMTLIARMTVHTQQICGLAWAPDGEFFASGGNDNNCFLFETKKSLRLKNRSGNTSATLDVREGPEGESIYTVTNRSSPVLQLPHTAARHKWTLNAAVKAISFCPWQRGLVAIGGGSNDRCIHFYHTQTGTCLATIDCAAQVTGLVWSKSRREIAATFGFTQPEHPYRVAVFAWPSCEQVVAVPWWDEHRALCAIAYPGGPEHGMQTDEDCDDGRLRRVEDGCIVVAASDSAIRFHEIWSDKRSNVGAGGLMNSGMAGLLGGSDILEELHGIAREGAIIR